jgi:hypothetical protein
MTEDRGQRTEDRRKIERRKLPRKITENHGIMNNPAASHGVSNGKF